MNGIHTDEGRRQRIVAGWLLVVCAMIFVMVVLGGVTRLTFSGLSMVEWRPVTGWLPPLTHDAWQAAFEAYRQSPEYQKINVGMGLGEFQSIFWMEYLHRLWGRVIGVAYLLPFLFFLARGWLDRRLIVRLVVGLLLGGFQGWLGWYMVKSGLVDKPDVSAYRLVAHLAAALTIYGFLFWVALGLLRPNRGRPRPGAVIVVILVATTILAGGFVAGLDAGFAYNTFPTMDGHWLPPGFFAMEPAWLSAFEDIGTVQFDHRVLALTTLVAVLLFWWRRRGRLSVDLLGAMAAVQVGLGIATLLLVVPVPLAAAHQAGAVILLTLALWATHENR